MTYSLPEMIVRLSANQMAGRLQAQNNAFLAWLKSNAGRP